MAMELQAPVGSLADLPEACIVTALLFLDVRDALRVRRTCRRIHLILEQSQKHYWLPRLRKDFGLHVQVNRYPELVLRWLWFLAAESC